ncbi:nitrate reductase molybdenum cofactor assembly chaperone, partial [Oleiphilus sp. HI0085]
PREDILLYKGELDQVVAEAGLAPAIETKLLAFIENRAAMDLMDWQSEYGGLFDRGRSVALWLFEHVHGESRDRGQAMVDLVDMYREAGLELDKHELPDYIPLFLEFLSTQGKENAQNWLQEMEHILGLIQCRLEKRKSDYSVLFEALLDFADSKIELDEIREQIADEKRDDTKKAIDKEWEEEEVKFGAESLDKSCESSTRRPSEAQRRDQDIPVNWVGFDATPSSSQSSISDKRG